MEAVSSILDFENYLDEHYDDQQGIPAREYMKNLG